MAFRFKKGESVSEGVRRIVCDQIDKAIEEIDDSEIDAERTVHQVRKRCKKIRGVLRVVRGSMKKKLYQRENVWYRDAARLLSDARDAQTMINTFELLRERFEQDFQSAEFRDVYKRLVDHRHKVVQTGESLQDHLRTVHDRMVQGRKSAFSWNLKDSGFDALAEGLGKTYKRGRKAMNAAYGNPSAEAFHEWRKRVKYHWYHVRLLEPLWKAPVEARADELKTLSDFLGDDHDLAVFREVLTADPAAYGGTEIVRRLGERIAELQAELRHDAHGLGGRIYAEKKKPLLNRMESYWDVWQREAV